MPAGLLQSLADQFNVSLETAEKAWADCKKAIRPVKEAREGGRPSYGVVVDCVKAKLGNLAKKGATQAVEEQMRSGGEARR